MNAVTYHKSIGKHLLFAFLLAFAVGTSQIKSYEENKQGDGCEIVDECPLIVLQESYEGELLIPPNPSYEWWQIRYSEVMEKFYEMHDDQYDFLALLPTARLKSHASCIVNRNIYGIGNDQIVHTYPALTEKLRSWFQLDFYHIYKFYKDSGSEPVLDPVLLERVLIHEIGHHWGIQVKGLKKDIDEMMHSHWIYNIDLFSGDPNYVDPMGYVHWIIENDEEQCVNNAYADAKFSNLTLYLMGLIPASDVAVTKVHDFEEIPGDYYYNLYGPHCSDDPNFTGTREVSIQDIIEVNGERIPSYENSQKDFCVAFVVIVPYDDSDIDYEFINYVKEYRQALPDAWVEMTGYKSTMSHFACFDLNNDCLIGFLDYAVLANNWMKTGSELDGDINKDNKVDYKDLTMMTKYWLCNL